MIESASRRGRLREEPLPELLGALLRERLTGVVRLQLPSGPAEVYLVGYGWVPVDPADVRKVVLDEPPGNLAIGDPRVRETRARLFGSWEMNWIAYNVAHDVALPGSKRGGTLPYLMYPQCETANGRLDSLDPESFSYEITTREVLQA